MPITDAVTLLNVAEHIVLVIDQQALQSRYADLASSIGSVPGQSGNVSNAQALQNKIKELLGLIKAGTIAGEPPTGWPREMVEIFDRLGARKILGRTAAQQFETAILHTMSIPGNAVDVVNQRAGEVNERKRIIGQIASALKGLTAVPAAPTQPTYEALIELVFGTSTESSLEDFESVLADWKYVLANVARLAHLSGDSPKIVSIRRGSWEVILASVLGLGTAVAAIAEKVYSIREKKLSAKKISLEIESRLGDRELAQAVEAKAETEKVSNTKAAATDLMTQFNWPEGAEYNQIIVVVESSIEKIYEYHDRGGMVRVKVLKENGDPANRVEALLQAAQRIEALTTDIESLKRLPPAVTTPAAQTPPGPAPAVPPTNEAKPADSGAKAGA